MRRTVLVMGFLMGAGFPSPAQLLFTNVNSNLFSGFKASLNAVAYDGASTFLGVGNGKAYVQGSFVSGQPLRASGNWLTSAADAGQPALYAVAPIENGFVATGAKNQLFAFNSGFSSLGRIFKKNGARGAGLAFDGSQLAAVVEAPEIAYTSSAEGLWTTVTGANLPGRSFVESFRGATPFGPNGFAACGILGVVRVTTTGAAGPWKKINGGVKEGDFLGIASDGATTLVCVGVANPTAKHASVRGFIESFVTSNGGSTWSMAYSNVFPKGTFNAVAYTGTGFLVAGGGGQIAFSPDGITWPSPSGLGNDSFNGVAFATQGNLQGVGILVGTNGTLWLAGTNPPAPTFLGNQTNCQGMPNPALQVSVANSVGTNLVTVDWYTQPSGGDQVTNGATSYFPTNTMVGTLIDSASNYTYYAEARDLRTGFVSTNRTAVTLSILPQPSVVLNNNYVICNGQSNTLAATLHGLGPWKVTWSDGTTQQTNTSTSGGPVTLFYTVSPTEVTNVFLDKAVNYTFSITSITSLFTTNDCMASASAGDLQGVDQVTVNPRPTAQLVSTNEICNGMSSDILVILHGLGPWTVTWSDGTPSQTSNSVSGAGPFTLSHTVSPANLFQNITTNYFYTVASLTTANGCSANEPGDIQGTNEVIVYPRPTSTLSDYSATNCNEGTPYYLTNVLTGLGPWTVTWVNSGGYSNSQMVLNTNLLPGLAITNVLTVIPTNTLLNWASNNMFYVAAVVDNSHPCTAQLGDITNGTDVNILIYPRPTSTLSDYSATNCNEGMPYYLTNVLTGLGPWTVTWTNSGGYSNSQMVLNTNLLPGLAITNVFTVIPTNTLLNWASNNMYYVAAVVDNTNGCLAHLSDITNGTDVNILIYPRPTSTLYDYTVNQCNYGETNYLTNVLTGLGPWVVTWTNSGGFWTNQTVPNTNGIGQSLTNVLAVLPINTLQNLVSNNMYYVAAVVDNSLGCTAEGSDISNGTDVNIMVYPRPTSTLYDYTVNQCNYGETNYLTNVLTGLGPWVVTWTNSGGFWTNQTVPNTNGIGNSLTNVLAVLPINTLQNLISNNMYYVAAVADNSLGCTAEGSDINNGTDVNILVYPRPTSTLYNYTMDQCNYGETNYLTNVLTGLGPWVVTWTNSGGFWTNQTVPNTNGIGHSLTNVLAVLPTNTLQNLVSNNMYYVAAVMDNSLGCAAQGGDLSNGTNVSIMVYPLPSGLATNVVNQTNCFGMSNLTLSVYFASSNGGNWYLDGTNNVTNNAVSFTPTNTAPGTYVYTVFELGTNGCQSTTSTNVELVIVALPSGTPTSVINVTNCAGLTNPPLTVYYPSGNGANWYLVTSNATNWVATNVNSYVSQLRTPGTDVYQVYEVNANSCPSATYTNLTLTLLPCINAPAISAAGTNTVIEWFGNLELQSATSLTGPWTTISNPPPGVTNYWTNTILPAPTNLFFRLYGPTN